MDLLHYNQQLFEFLSNSPTPFHAVKCLEEHLLSRNFQRLTENSRWQLMPGNSYFVSREDCATVAFTLGSKEAPEQGMRMIAAHTDSPCLKIKPQPDIKTGTYHQLGVEVYGGSLLHPWFDRLLSVAGRVYCELNDGDIAALLVDFRRPLLIIPSIAIHLNRDVNKQSSINQQSHLPPIISQSVDRQLPDFKELLLDQIGTEYPGRSIRQIFSFDLFCYDCQPPAYTGVNDELISAARLDNLLSCHAGITALTEADRTRNGLVYFANHEENGSRSATGAHGSFLDNIVERIIPDPEARQICMSNSFLISADNAHAVHPNYPDRTDAAHEVELNRGPVIKNNANQRYATSGLSAAVFRRICRMAEISPQEFVMRSDMACGSTIGPITAARLGVKTIDIGAPTLAMHSIREVTGSEDPYLLFASLVQFLNDDIHRQQPG